MFQGLHINSAAGTSRPRSDTQPIIEAGMFLTSENAHKLDLARSGESGIGAEPPRIRFQLSLSRPDSPTWEACHCLKVVKH